MDRIQKKVLILHSLHYYGNTWSESIRNGIFSTLEASSELDIKIDVEFMDFLRFMTPEYHRFMIETLKMKHKQSRYDLIITVNDDAFKLLRERGEEIFPGTPFVFCAVLYLHNDRDTIAMPLAGVNEAPDFLTGMKMMATLFPERKNIYFITDLAEPGQSIKKEMEKIISLHRWEGYTYRIMQDYSEEELLDALSHMGDGDIVYLGIFSRDNQMKYHDPKESARMICEAAGEVPVFGTWDFVKEFGITGGYLLDGYKQGRLAAEKGIRILQGEKVDDVGITWDSPHSYYFEYTALKKYGIPLKDLPEETLLLHQPQGLFHQYRKELIALISFILILLTFSLSLLWMNFQLKVLKRALQKEKDLLDKKVEERTQSIHAMQKKVILRERQAAAGSMLAGMAHEMNTPIGAAITALSFLMNKRNETDALAKNGRLSPVQVSQFIKDCEESMHLAFNCMSRTAKLINEFKALTLAEPLSDQTRFDVFDFLMDIKTAYSKQLEDQGITFRIEGKHVLLNSYPGIIYRIMTSLILNSLDHGFPQGWQDRKLIEVSCDRQDWSNSDSPLILRYRDNGKGLSPDIIERIYEPFTTTDRSKGKVGLGLHKVYKLVTEKLLGTIEYSDLSKKGTQFTIHLPVSDSPE